MSVWALYINHPTDNVAAGDLHSIKVIAQNAADAQQYAWRHAVRSGNRNESIWLDGHDSILVVSEFDTVEPAGTAPGEIVEASRWVVTCKFCEAELNKESCGWVDSNTGGVYDHCTVNTGDPNEYPSAGHRPAKGTSVDQAR